MLGTVGPCLGAGLRDLGALLNAGDSLRLEALERYDVG